MGADEAAVDLFLKGRIAFTEIACLVEEVLTSCSVSEPKSLDDAIGYIVMARAKALELAGKFCA